MASSSDSSIVDLARVVFSALVLVISAGVTSHIFHGYSNKKWRTSFIGLLLLMLIGTQVYYLLQAVLFVPAYPFQYDSSLLRLDCLDSGKGGKRSRSSTEAYDANPCYNITNNATNITYNDKYISYTRNCYGGFGGECTQQEPCDPCDREFLPLLASSEGGQARCRACSASFRGDCRFVPGVGPYCREEPGSRVVVPCTRCCTQGAALFINDTCY